MSADALGKMTMGNAPDSIPEFKGESRPRITVVEQVYYQPNEEGVEPLCIPSGFCYAPESDEQPYTRHVRLRDCWQEIDTGWYSPEKVGLLIVTNNSQDVIEVGVRVGESVTPISILLPEESIRVRPYDVEMFSLRMARTSIVNTSPASAKVTINILPG